MLGNSIIYNIPADLIDAYRERRVIVRATNPAELVRALSESDLDYVHYVQLLSVAEDFSVLGNWGLGFPFDIVLHEPETEFAKLYNCAKLIDKHPLRVTIPVQRGFGKAVKVAASLGYAIKLTVGQPNGDEIREMFEVLEMFLHQQSFSQSVEFFQGSLQTFLRDENLSLWDIQEENPAQFRYITGEGLEIISPRFLDWQTTRSLEFFINHFRLELLAERKECETCEFLSHCRGYFKWSNKDYVCEGGVKDLFRAIRNAADELRADLSAFAELEGELQQ